MLYLHQKQFKKNKLQYYQMKLKIKKKKKKKKLKKKIISELTYLQIRILKNLALLAWHI